MFIFNATRDNTNYKNLCLAYAAGEFEAISMVNEADGAMIEWLYKKLGRRDSQVSRDSCLNRTINSFLSTEKKSPGAGRFTCLRNGSELIRKCIFISKHIVNFSVTLLFVPRLSSTNNVPKRYNCFYRLNTAKF